MRERVDTLIELIGLDAGEIRDRYPAQLSGGQRQRVGVARALAADPPLMLMDEPFGAIDPINRERLQNEFLRLQDELRKTVVFVTHDIDEAIKIGDRIAILKTGGVLAQYATPAELLMHPADAFVEDFVGADRALKRLALRRVRDVDLWTAPRVRVGDTVDAARAAMAGSDVPYPLVVDDGGRPVAWLDEDDLRGERIEPGAGSPVLTVDRDDVLRDALSDLLQSEVQYGAVVGGRGPRRGHPGRSSSSTTSSCPRPRARSAGMTAAGLAVVAQSGNDFFRNRSSGGDQLREPTTASAPDWIVHHLDRYIDPVLSSTSCLVAGLGGDRLRDRLRRWRCSRTAGAGSSAPITQVTGILYTIPSLAAFFLLLPITGRGRHDGDHRADRLHAARSSSATSSTVSTACPRRRATPAAGWA